MLILMRGQKKCKNMVIIVEFCNLIFVLKGGVELTLLEKILILIIFSDASIDEIANILNLSPIRMIKKIKDNKLNVKEAQLLSNILNIKKPVEVFFE